MTDETKMGRPAGSGSWLPKAARQSRQDRATEMKSARNTAILEAAIAEAKEQGYQWITREAVAKRAGVSVGSVSNAYERMVFLKRAVLRAAIDREILEIVAQGLADGSEIARGAPSDLKQRAAVHLT